MQRTLTTLLAVLVLALAGCGGDDDEGGGESAATSTPTTESTPEATPEETPAGDDGGGGGGETLTVAAPEDGGLVFEPDTLTAGAGEIEIEFDNPSTVPHALAIEGGDNAATDEVTGDSATVATTLEPGEYTFFCPVGSHRQAGMEGTLTVE